MTFKFKIRREMFSKIHVQILNLFQSDFDPAVFGMDLVCIICSLMWPYLFCHFGNSTMNLVSHVGDIAYNSNWFNYPAKIQKDFIFVVLRSHKRNCFIGFHLVPCTMEVFGQVCAIILNSFLF